MFHFTSIYLSSIDFMNGVWQKAKQAVFCPIEAKNAGIALAMASIFNENKAKKRHFEFAEISFIKSNN